MLPFFYKKKMTYKSLNNKINKQDVIKKVMEIFIT